MVAGIGQSNNNWNFLGLTRRNAEENSFAQSQGQGFEFGKISGGIPQINGSETVSGISSAQKTNANESLVSRLDRVKGELTPESRNAFQGQKLYCMG